MAEVEHTIVLSYDVSAAGTRRRVSKFLEERLVRVQYSVFEGRLTPSRAHRLFDAAAAMLDETDSLRLYIMTREGMEKSRVHGGVPVLQDEGYFLL